MNWPCAVSSQTLPKDYLSNFDSTIGLLSLNSQNSLAGTDQFPIADSLTYCFYVRREIFDDNPRVNRNYSSFPKIFHWKAKKFQSFWSKKKICSISKPDFEMSGRRRVFRSKSARLDRVDEITACYEAPYRSGRFEPVKISHSYRRANISISASPAGNFWWNDLGYFPNFFAGWVQLKIPSILKIYQRARAQLSWDIDRRL